jgi:hypothetical protein
MTSKKEEESNTSSILMTSFPPLCCHHSLCLCRYAGYSTQSSRPTDRPKHYTASPILGTHSVGATTAPATLATTCMYTWNDILDDWITERLSSHEYHVLSVKSEPTASTDRKTTINHLHMEIKSSPYNYHMQVVRKHPQHPQHSINQIHPSNSQPKR